MNKESIDNFLNETRIVYKPITKAQFLQYLNDIPLSSGHSQTVNADLWNAYNEARPRINSNEREKK